MPEKSSNSNMTHYKLGRLAFNISGAGDVARAVRSELGPITDEADSAQLSFRFVETLPELKETHSYFKPVTSTPTAYRVDDWSVSHIVSTASSGETQVNVVTDSAIARRYRILPTSLNRARNWNYLLRYEEVAKNFMYRVFDYTTQLNQLSLGQSYLHASTFERDGKGIGLVAWGGIGKTTSLLKFVTEEGWNFLSDDLGLIDDNGTIYRTPKRMQIYAYNLEGQPEIEEMLLDERSQMDLLSWSYMKHRKGLNGVRRRVSAEDFFGAERVGTQAALEQLIFIERNSDSDFSCSDLSPTMLAERAASTLFNELDPFSNICAARQSAGHLSLVPRHGEFFETVRDLLVKCFGNVPTKLVTIPKNAGPDELVTYLKTQLTLG